MSLEFKGKYADCIVYTNEIEEEAISQIYGFLNHNVFEGATIRIMPDCHSGKGAVIGFTATLGDKIIPNVIGVDIACGVLNVELGNIDIDFALLDAFIRENIPSGYNIHSKRVSRHVMDNAYSRVRKQLKLDCLSGECIDKIEAVCRNTKQQDISRVINSLGSLGSGNHYLELGESGNKIKHLSIHSGSRNFGLKIAQFHQTKAKNIKNYGELSYLEGADAQAYLEDMKVAQIYAVWNRQIMAELITQHLGIVFDEYIESIHNYIDFERGIIRKGAVSAEKDQLLVIPWNMRDGFIIGKGKGNADWNYSAPHGAGRKMSRTVAKSTLSMEEFTETMTGVWTSCINNGTLDESPMAYKDCSKIEAYLEPSVEIITRVKPLYNFKASEEKKSWKEKKMANKAKKLESTECS